MRVAGTVKLIAYAKTSFNPVDIIYSIGLIVGARCTMFSSEGRLEPAKRDNRLPNDDFPPVRSRKGNYHKALIMFVFFFPSYPLLSRRDRRRVCRADES